MPSLKAQLFLVKKLSWNNCGVILREFNIKSSSRALLEEKEEQPSDDVEEQHRFDSFYHRWKQD